MKKDKAKNPGVLKSFIILLPMVYKTSPYLFIWCQAISILHGISLGVITLFQQWFFDSATGYAQDVSMLSSIIISLLLLGLIIIINQILNGLGNFLPGVLALKAQGILSKEIHIKMSRLHPVDFENTDNLDNINKADQGKDNAVWFTLSFLIIFTFYIPYFAFMSYYLFSLKPILSLAIIAVFLPTLSTQILRAKIFSKLEDKSAPIRREHEYYEKCMVSQEYFKETRLLGAFHYFKKLYTDSLILLNKISFRADVKTNLAELSMKIIAAFGYFIILYMLFISLMNKEISVGAFSAVFASIGMMFSIMDEVICNHISKISKDIGTIQNFINFLNMGERNGNIDKSYNNENIIIKNASFSYPKSERKALKNIDLTIKNKETIAIVGENGSGKSTLIRLITGLYTPTEGSVYYGEENTKNIKSSTLFKNTSAVFQKYQRYQLTLKENIFMSQTEIPYMIEKLDKICEMTGVNKDDSSFINGYDTMLSREFDGVDLSGGQWQRIAIARGLYKNHELIILDEPTAAIDPFEETRIYNRFAEISKDKTAIIVTHRLGSVKLADRIVVMKSGEIAEMGTHDELIEMDGEYRIMFEAQQKWYIIEEGE